MRRLLCVLAALALGTPSLVACDEPAPPVPRVDAGPRDASRPDAAGDAGDGGAGVDAGRAAHDPARCRAIDTSAVELGNDPVTDRLVRRVAVAAGAGEYATAWSQTIDGFLQIRVAILGSEGGAPVTVDVTEGFFIHEQPAIARVGSGFLVAWVDTRDADFEIYARTVAVDGTLGAEHRLSERMGRDEVPALIASGSGVVASWADVDTGSGARRGITRALAMDGTPSGAPRTVVSGTPSFSVPLLGTLGMGLALAWVDSATATPELYLQALDASGAALGSAMPLTTESNASGDADLVLTDDGAVLWGAIAGAFPDVRGRVVDATGMPTGSPVILTIPPESGTHASGTRLLASAGWAESCRNGYAIAYRARDGGTSTTLRVLFVDAGLTRVAVLDLGPAAGDGGPSTIRMADDGTILVAWADQVSGGVTMRASRMRCD